MICLNSEGLFFLDQLKKLRAQTEINLDNDQEICSDESMDIIETLRKDNKARKEALIEEIKETNPEAMFADGFDDSILGYDTKGRVVYSVDAILETLTERDNMSVDEARDYFYFNIDGAYVGEYTPIYIY